MVTEGVQFATIASGHDAMIVAQESTESSEDVVVKLVPFDDEAVEENSSSSVLSKYSYSSISVVITSQFMLVVLNADVMADNQIVSNTLRVNVMFRERKLR